MRLQLQNLAPHLKLSILKKLNFEEFVHFHQCSRDSLKISNSLTTRLPFTIDCLDIYRNTSYFVLTQFSVNDGFDGYKKAKREIILETPVKFNCDCTYIHRMPNDENYSQLLSTFQNLETKSSHLCFESAENGCNLSTVHKMTEVLDVDKLTLMVRNPDFSYKDVHFPAFVKLRSFILEGEIPEEVVLILTTKELSIRLVGEGILSAGFMNNYLKNPAAQSLTFNTSTREFDEENDHTLFQDLSISTIWRGENHKESPIFDIEWEGDARACVVSNRNMHSLVYINDSSFHMDRLDGETEEEVMDNAWECLKKRLDP